MDSIKKRLCDAYGLSFEDVIQTVHWKHGISLIEIAKKARCSRNGIAIICKKLGIAIRNKKEAGEVYARRQWFLKKRKPSIYPDPPHPIRRVNDKI